MLLKKNGIVFYSLFHTRYQSTHMSFVLSSVSINAWFQNLFIAIKEYPWTININKIKKIAAIPSGEPVLYFAWHLHKTWQPPYIQPGTDAQGYNIIVIMVQRQKDKRRMRSMKERAMIRLPAHALSSIWSLQRTKNVYEPNNECVD